MTRPSCQVYQGWGHASRLSGWAQTQARWSAARPALRVPLPALLQSLPAGLTAQGSPRADIHVLAPVLALLLHQQLLQPGVDIQEEVET